jgi:hypothetical protein
MKERYDVLPMTSAQDFLSLMRRSHSAWLREGQVDTTMIFRGKSDSSYELQPSAWRDAGISNRIVQGAKSEIYAAYNRKSSETNNFDEYLRVQILNCDLKSVDRVASYVLAIVCELYLVDDFIRRANAIGLRVDKVNPFQWFSNVFNVSAVQAQILLGRDSLFPYGASDRLECIKYIIDGGVVEDSGVGKFNTMFLNELYQNTFSSFALAQHHNIPTRLLDWTRDPMKAAFFAVDGLHKDSSEIAVFALDARVLPLYGVEVIDGFPRSEFHFLHKQEGVFTHIPSANIWYLQHGKWPSIEDVLSAPDFHGRFVQLANSNIKPIKVTLDRKHVPELRRLLHVEMITKESLMPTYTHIADAIRDRLKME